MYNNSIGVAAPNAYPITAPKPPHVVLTSSTATASIYFLHMSVFNSGPNSIHAPKADAAKLVVNENIFSSLFPII